MKSMRKRLAALLCTAAMIVSGVPTAFPVTAKAEVLEGFDNVVQQVAAEGCVLVKNENNVLPLAKNTKISVFGRSQCHYDKYRVFAGSGDGVKVEDKYAVSILDALRKEDSGLKVNEDLVNTYAKWVKENPYQNSNDPENPKNTDWDKRRLSQPEMELDESLVKDAKSKSDVAVVIISRLSGEDCDAKLEKGSYFLQDAEEDMLKEVTAQFDKVVVLLNITNIIDMSWVEKYGVESVLYVWNGGQSGGAAVADVLNGTVNPSGKLADTVAKSAEDYPSYNNYGKEYYTNYEEDIYLGYRYFETFAPDKVQYPFGYGLSYTDFEIKNERVVVSEDEGTVEVVVTVKNTGSVEGQEVVQVYYGAPQNKLGNPVKELAAFAKTRKLGQGETETLSIKFNIKDMASYDDSGVTGHESCYVLEAGDYNIYLGDNVRDAELVHTFSMQETVVEQLTEAAAPIHDFQRMKAVVENGKIVKKMEDVPKRTETVEQISKRVNDSLPDKLEKKDNNKYTLLDVYNKTVSMEQFVAQMSKEDLAAVTQGSSDGVDKYMGGSGSPFGGMLTKDGDTTTSLKKKYGVPVVTCVDGPAGAKINVKSTLLPSGNVIGCTWNLELIEELFRMEGQEMVKNEVDNLLGPGMNLHRDPRNGRNAEYYSEDPLLTGRLGAAAAKGIQESGATATGKHLACNNQERYRRTVDSRISERALREIYLKPFEIFIKEGNGRAIMTAYNPVNGCYTSCNYDLNTTIMRNEWKYDGMIMTDWWADSLESVWAAGETEEQVRKKKNGDRRWVMLRSGGDIFMITNGRLYDYVDKNTKKVHEFNPVIEQLFKDIDSGKVTIAEMQRSAVNVLNLVIKSQAFYRDHLSKKMSFEQFVKDYVKPNPGEDWFTVGKAESGNPQVTGITVGGRKVSSFNPIVSEYKVYVPEGTTEFPEVEATVAEGTTVTYQAATKDNPVTIVAAKEKQSTLNYRIVFTSAEGVTPVLENSVLAAAADIQVNGESIPGFDADTYQYVVALDSLEKEPKVAYKTPEGVTAEVEYDKTKNIATIKCVSKDQAVRYTLNMGIAPKSDEFNDAELNKIWTVESENKSNWTLEDGKLAVTAEKGSLFEGENDHKNQFVQQAYGDWEAVAKVDLSKIPDEDYQSIGVVVKQDDDNYIYPKIEYSGELEITYTQEKSGKKEDLETLDKSDLAKFTDSVYFKLTKLGNTYLAAVSPDGKDYIRFAKAASAEYESPKFALVAGTGSKETEEIQAKFDYVQFKTKGLGDTVKIEDGTKLNVAEVEPIGISATMGRTFSETKESSYLTAMAPGDYAEYTIDVEQSGYYDVSATYASDASDTQQLRMVMYIDGKVAGDQFGPGTGGAESWSELSLGNTRLTAGTHKFKIEFVNSDVNLNYVRFKQTEEIDDAGLGEALKIAKEKDLSVYSEESRTAYEAAIQAATEVLATAEKKEDFEAALAELKKAEEGLTAPTIDTVKAELTVAVGAAKLVLDAGKGENTDAVWQAFVEAYNAAAEPKEDATVEELAQLKANLVAAQAALVGEDTPGSENNGTTGGTTGGAAPDAATAAAELKALVEKEKATYESDGDKYTVDSWLKYVEAYIAATEADADATAEELVQLKKNLETAKAGLKEVGGTNTGTDLEKAKTELTNALESLKEVYETGEAQYTASTWKTFKSAYKAAEDKLNDADATEKELKNYKDKLQKAYDNLEKKAGTTNPDEQTNGTQGTQNNDPANNGGQSGSNVPVDTTKFVDQVQVTADKTELYAGGNAENTTSLNVTLPNGAALQSVTYESTSPKVATVDGNGKITAKKMGDALITANVTLTNGETKAFCLKITVNKAYIKKVNVPSTVKKGKKATLRATVYGSTKAVTWKIKSGSKYAKITKKGKLTAKAKGKVKVVAKSGKISKTFIIRIK